MNKTFLLVALLTSGLIAQAQDLRPEPTSATERVEQATFGELTEYRLYYSNGQLKQRSYVKNGKRHGTFAMYSENGSLLIQGQYIQGKKVGTWLTSAADQSQKYLVVFGTNGTFEAQTFAAN